jgi:hypothetical protein
MPIKNFKIGLPGESSDVVPRFGHLETSDTLAVVAGASYLNPYMQANSVEVKPTDFIFVAAADGHQIYKPVFSGTNVTLTVLP